MYLFVFFKILLLMLLSFFMFSCETKHSNAKTEEQETINKDSLVNQKENNKHYKAQNSKTDSENKQLIKSKDGLERIETINKFPFHFQVDQIALDDSLKISNSLMN